jgi:hypothetical protein
MPTLPKMDESEIRRILTISAGPFAVETARECFRGFRTEWSDDDRFRFNDLVNEDLEHVHDAGEIHRIDRVDGDVRLTKWPCRECVKLGDRKWGHFVASAIPLVATQRKSISYLFECPHGHHWLVEVPAATE